MNAGRLRRYSRHLLIPEVGLAGQEKLDAARVLVVGAGGLGSPALQYLAAAGVGRIGVVDDDVVDETNLQRQTIFATADVGRNKAVVAAERLRALNPLGCRRCDAGALRCRQRARLWCALYDAVLDCTDRFPTRYLINDACFLENRPDIYGSIFRFDGQVSVFARALGPVLSLSLSRSAAAGSRADLRRRRRAGRAGGNRRLVASLRGAQSTLGDRRSARRPSDADRYVGGARSRSAFRSGSGVPSLRRRQRRSRR